MLLDALGFVAPGASLDPTCPVNWSHPLNQGLVAEWAVTPLQGWRGSTTLHDLVRGGRSFNDAILTTTGTIVPDWRGSPAPFGFGVLHSVQANNSFVKSTKPSLSLWASDFSAFCWFDKFTTGGAGFDSVMSSVSTGNNGWTIEPNVFGSGGKVGFTYYGVSDNATSFAAPAGTGMLALTKTGSTATVYLWSPSGGIQSQAFTAVMTAPDTDGVVLMAGWRSGGMLGNPNIDLYAAQVFSRVLTTSDFAGLIDQFRKGNPARWRWLGTREYSFPSAVSGKTISVSDNLALQNVSVSRVAASFRKPQDNLGISDAVSRQSAVSRLAQDNLALSDLVSRQSASFRLLLDNLAINDGSASVRDQKCRILPADNLAISDSIIAKLAGALRILLSDNLAISDFLQRQVSSFRSIADNLALSDALLRQVSSFRAILDNLAVSDLASRLAASLRTMQDNLGVLDLLSRQALSNRLAQDNLGVTDLFSRQSSSFRITQDNLAITDLVSRQVSSFRKLIDNLGITDLVTIIDLPPGAVNWHVQISDNLALSDPTIKRLVAALRLLADNIAITDQTSILTNSLRKLSDNIAVSDAVATITGSRRLVSDNLALHDTLSLFTAFARLVSDNIGVQDTVARLVSAFRSVQDNLGLQDAAQRLTTSQRLVSDNLALQDSASRSVAYFRQIVDLLALADAVTATKVGPGGNFGRIIALLGYDATLIKLLGHDSTLAQLLGYDSTKKFLKGDGN